MHQASIIMAVHHTSIMAQFHNNLHHTSIWLSMYCAPCIKFMDQSCAPWINAVYPQLITVHQASVWLNTIYMHQASLWFNGVHQASMWLNTVHQASLCYIAAQCASCINMARWCASMHQYGLMLYIRHQYGSSGIIVAQYYGSMLCGHQFMARCCASGITIRLKPGHHVSIRLDVVHQAVLHASIWLNTVWLITVNLPHHTLSTSFFLLAVNTWRKEMKRWTFCLVAGLLLCP